MAEDLVFDHVIYGVADLDAASHRFSEQHGMRWTGGGVHPGGTKNIVCRFADGSYLELLAVNDRSASTAQFLEPLIADGDTLVGWAVRAADIDAVAERIGREPVTGSIELPDGTVGTWRTIAAAGAAGPRPFFIRYDGRRDNLAVDADFAGIAWVETGGSDTSWVQDWLGDADLDIRCVDGPPRLLAVGITRADGSELVLR